MHTERALVRGTTWPDGVGHLLRSQELDEYDVSKETL